MITAAEAKTQSLIALEEMQNELTQRLKEAINAACKQGLYKITFYPKSALQKERAVTLLNSKGFKVRDISARDQRDNDRIEIEWGNER